MDRSYICINYEVKQTLFCSQIHLIIGNIKNNILFICAFCIKLWDNILVQLIIPIRVFRIQELWLRIKNYDELSKETHVIIYSEDWVPSSCKHSVFHQSLCLLSQKLNYLNITPKYINSITNLPDMYYSQNNFKNSKREYLIWE
jgi:hypothetical protein